MKFADYLKYFFFIGKHWNYRLALFTIYYEIKGEKKYKINTGKIDFLKNEKIESGNLKHASIYQASSYYLISKAFDYLKDEKVNNGLVDFGCGKGRVLSVAAFYDFKKITGIDFSKKLCDEANKNIEKIKPSFPKVHFKIICEDAVLYTIENDDHVFFFFNPFGETVMLKVVKNILQSLKQNPRKVFIVYLNPLHKEIFLSAGFIEEYYFLKMEFMEISIMSINTAVENEY